MIRGAAIAHAAERRDPRALGPGSVGTSGVVAIATLSAAVLGLWLASDVTVPEIARFVAYQGVFVLGPGWLLYRQLRPGDAWVPRRLAFSWVLGYALECGAFMLTAAVGLRSGFVAYPAVVALAAFAAGRRSRDRQQLPDGRLPPAWPWALAAVGVVSLAYVGLQYFGTSPLPGRIASASYGLDQVWNLSLAAEAKHHWPITDPTVAGTSLAYHLFATFDVAATSQVTGLPLPLVLFRLWPVPLVILVCLQLFAFGSSVGRRAWAGPLAAGLVLLGSELNLDPHLGYKFANELSDDILVISPSFLLGVAFFLPTVTLLHELAGARTVSPRTMLLLGLLLFGCAGAKATILPVLVGGLALYVVWRGVRTRDMHWPTLAALSMTALAYVLSDLLVYGAAGSYGLSFDPPGAVRQMPALGAFVHGLPGGLGAVGWAGAAVLGLAGAYWLVLVAVAAQSGRGQSRRQAAPLLICIALTGAVPFLVFTHYGFSQVFFMEYGLIALSPLAADALLWIWSDLRARRGAPQLGLLAGALLLLIGIAAFMVPRVLGASAAQQNGVFSTIDLVLAGVAALVLVRLALPARPARAAWLYAAAALSVIAMVAKPLTTIPPAVTRLSLGQPLYSQVGRALTADLNRGLEWLRDHTDPHAVVAVNNYRDGSLYWDTGWRTADDYYYTALGERRTFLEGWVYAQRSFTIGEADVFAGRKVPFSGRLRLNDAIFQQADRKAFNLVVRRWHVQYLVVDRVHNWATPWLAYLAHPVYCNPDLLIYAVTRPPTRTPAARLRVDRCARVPPTAFGT